jgi:Fe-S-cluster-containing dehydrogenase component
MLGAGAAGALGVAREAKANNEDFEGYPDSNGVLVDTSVCIGCRSCEEACDRANNLGKPAKYFADNSVFEKPRRTQNNEFTVVNRFQSEATGNKPVFVKKQCMHCNEPACFAACLAKAFSKSPTGAVVYNQDVCIGCRYCMQACPFYAPTYEYDRAFTPRVRKCTFCLNRISQPGGVPACVEACPTDAILFGKRKDLLKIAQKKLANDSSYVDHIYGQNEVGGTSWMYISKVPFEQLGFKMDLGTTALPKKTYGFLATIPVLHIGLPILLAGFYTIAKAREKSAKEHPEEGRK